MRYDMDGSGRGQHVSKEVDNHKLVFKFIFTGVTLEYSGQEDNFLK
jgi:hypothetical protein